MLGDEVEVTGGVGYRVLGGLPALGVPVCHRIRRRRPARFPAGCRRWPRARGDGARGWPACPRCRGCGRRAGGAPGRTRSGRSVGSRLRCRIRRRVRSGRTSRAARRPVWRPSSTGCTSCSRHGGNRRTTGGLSSMRSCLEAESNVVTTRRAGIGTVGISSVG